MRAIAINQLGQDASQPLGRLALFVGALEAQALKKLSPAQHLAQRLHSLKRHIVGGDHLRRAALAQRAEQPLDRKVHPVVAGGEAVAPKLALRVEHQDADLRVGGEPADQLRRQDRFARAGLAKNAEHHRLAEAALLG